jgi:hypothetical protein
VTVGRERSTRARNLTYGGLVLGIASGVLVAACAPEEDAPVDEPASPEVRALTATSPTRTWRQVTGLLFDIATANGPPSRWGIDTNFGQNSFGQVGFRVVKWSGDRWAATNGRGVRIALKGTGDANGDGISDVFVPWVVTNDGRIWRANNTSGSSWTQLPELNFGVTAVDVGSGGPVVNMTMYSAGSDGHVYQFFEQSNQWLSFSTSPTNVIRVSGPIRTDRGTANDDEDVMVLTSVGEVWAFLTSRVIWTRLGSETSSARTDLSAEGTLELASFSDGFLNSIMVTSSKPGDSNAVRTFQHERFRVAGTGDYVGTGPYTAGGAPIGSAPIAVSSDVDHHRVWIVTANNRVYYGE